MCVSIECEYIIHVFELIVCHCFHYDEQKMQKINKYLLLGFCFVNSRINYSKAPRAPKARDIHSDKTDVGTIVNLSLTCINPFRIILLLLLCSLILPLPAADIIFYALRNCESFFLRFILFHVYLS